MQIFTLKQVQAIVEHAGPEGLWTSYGAQIDGEHVEMMIGHPAHARHGEAAPAVRDVSAVRLAGSEDHVVAAHTELGALFLDMLAAGEL
jgi:hypothetical protein